MKSCNSAKKCRFYFRVPAVSFSMLLIALLLTLTTSCRSQTQQKSYVDITNTGDEKKIDSILSVLSLEEKVNMLCGNGKFTSPGIERLGISDLQYTDGPLGIREEIAKDSWEPVGLTTDSATFFPCGSALAATWNTAMLYECGLAMGEEAKTRGKDILLAPAINITRTPLNGRTYEYMSEDPLLNSRLAVSYIHGVQQAGVAACVKHYAANNQETRRGSVDVNMDERTLREIYLPAFKAAVTEGGAYSVMSAYNKFRGAYCGENEYLLNKILKGEWGFKGMVVSDWGGTHSTVAAALNGLDVEMGTARYFNNSLLDSVKQGLVPVSVIDDKVRRILRLKLFTQRTPVSAGTQEVSTPAHNKSAYDIASESIVLLKNTRKNLPLKDIKNSNIVVIGNNALQKNAQGGFGAGVKARYEITPLEGLKNRIGKDAHIEFVQGYKATFHRGKPFGMFPDTLPDHKLIAEAAKAAARADITLLFIGNNREVETENSDRKNLNLPFGQDALIKAVCAANPNTILIMVAGAPVNMHVADSCASTIIWSWFNGSQAGYALADVLLGKINPSGKLPFTIPVKLNDSPAHALGTFPGNEKAVYSEGILVGYRWFDTKNIAPAYCFGYGLSYTDYAYGEPQTNKPVYTRKDTALITFNLSNTGEYDGYETVQLYVKEMNPKVIRPAKELKAFKKMFVTAGNETTVTLELPIANLAWFDEKLMNWVVNPGTYQLAIGASSRDIRKVAQIKVK